MADLISPDEPVIPDSAFATKTVTRDQAEALIGTERPTQEALDAEAAWSTEHILWGRQGWLTVDRLCRQAKAKLPELPVECRPPG